MMIKNIILQDLLKVLESLPSGTKKIDIEYIDNDEDTKIVIYPSGYVPDKKDDDNDSPDISIDEDLMNYL